MTASKAKVDYIITFFQCYKSKESDRDLGYCYKEVVSMIVFELIIEFQTRGFNQQCLEIGRFFCL